MTVPEVAQVMALVRELAEALVSPDQMLLPALMLAAVLCGGALVLRVDTARRRVDRQLEVAVLGSARLTAETMPGVDQDGRANRRARGATDRRLVRLAKRLFRYHPEAPMSISVSKVALAAAACALAATWLAHWAVPLWLAPVAGLAVGISVTRGLIGWQRDRYSNRLTRQLPDTIEIVVSAVRAGLPVAEAFRAVAREMPNPTREQFARVVDEALVGRPLEDGLLGIHERTGVTEYAMFAVTLAVQSRAGGRIAEVLQTLGETVRQRVALAARARALSAEVKLSARVLASLPIVAGTALSLLRPGYLEPLFADSRGRMLFALGVGSLVTGIFVMRRMIRKGTAV